MAISVNHNLMAGNTARTLNAHYGNLATSTQRLSSGLRINSSADDAAGLAIRELMRGDIAAYNQGIRNVNDAISMIQVVDGALGIIDEKLIRMKELAEQAATGTYDSTQRLMIDSEFQAMASEIQRIATATDFNGIKLIDGKYDLPVEGDLYNPIITAINKKQVLDYHTYGNNLFRNNYALGDQRVEITEGIESVKYYIKDNMLYKETTKDINISTYREYNEWYVSVDEWHFSGQPLCNPDDVRFVCWDGNRNGFKMLVDENQDTPDYFPNKIINQVYLNQQGPDRYSYGFDLDIDNDGKADMDYAITLPVPIDVNDLKNYIVVDKMSVEVVEIDRRLLNSRKDSSTVTEELGPIEDFIIDGITIHFGPMNDSAEDYYDIEKRDCTLKGLGLEDVRIETQDKAQEALVTINDAIVKKDQARAYYGAMQNRLENTVSNLTIQSENFQASESRISDVDVATEMTNFVRNQILTQSAVAMLSQANSMPQMAMQLIGG